MYSSVTAGDGDFACAGGGAATHYRVRYDRIDAKGKVSIRRAGRMHHLGIGSAHARKRVMALADEERVSVVEP